MNRVFAKKIIAAGLLGLSMALIACSTSDDGPSITTQPSDQTVLVGGTATFTVVATGSGLSYQWTQNGSAISGATGATLTLTDVVNADSGNFVCTVTNSSGTATSSTAVLRVDNVATVLSLTAGAQGNSQQGSFLDIDNMEDYLAVELVSGGGSTPDANIDLFYGYSTNDQSAAIYSPDVAQDGVNGGSGFTVAQNLDPANTTQIRATSVNFNSVVTKLQIDSIWNVSSVVSPAKVDLVNGTEFLAKSNQGRIVLIQASSVIQSASGTAVLTGLAKF